MDAVLFLRIYYFKRYRNITRTANPKIPQPLINPMLDNLVSVLREHRKRQLGTRMLLGDKWRPESGFENLVFTGSFGRCISENALYEDMKKIRTQIREDGHVFGEYTLHSLRHTFATRGFEKGIPLKVMQEILGHKSITMTLDIYSHVLPDKKG